jgi:hypothetical protein
MVSFPSWQRTGICMVSYQGVDIDGRTLTFGSGTRLQVHPSKCLTLGSSQRYRKSLRAFLGGEPVLPEVIFHVSCFMMFDYFEI